MVRSAIPNQLDRHLGELNPQALEDIGGGEPVRPFIGQNPDLPQIVEIETVEGDFLEPWGTGGDPNVR